MPAWNKGTHEATIVNHGPALAVASFGNANVRAPHAALFPSGTLQPIPLYDDASGAFPPQTKTPRHRGAVLHPDKRKGSPDWIRTSDRSVNSRLLYR